MKNMKFVIAIGSLVLASAAFLADDPAKRFISVKGYFHAIGPTGLDVGLNLTSTHFTTTINIGKTAILVTAASKSTIATMHTSISGNNYKLYYK
jgi:hypothetical protein